MISYLRKALCQMKMNFQAKTSLQKKDFTVTKASKLDYGVGDTVRHVKFGVGIVKNIADGGRDYEVTVDFDKVGVKKNVRRFCQAEEDLKMKWPFCIYFVKIFRSSCK